MLAKLIRKLKGSRLSPGERLLKWCELGADSDGTLLVRPRRARLKVSDFLLLADRLHRTRRESLDMICFDFSNVTKLTGPWGVHFAILLHLAQDFGGRVRMVGLRGQSAALAWVLGRSPAVKSLLSEDPMSSDTFVEESTSR
jgi:hypothetical protein